jgi:hypothetical protein
MSVTSENEPRVGIRGYELSYSTSFAAHSGLAGFFAFFVLMA